MGEVLRKSEPKEKSTEIAAVKGEFVRDEEGWVCGERIGKRKEKMLKGFTAEFREPPPEIEAKLKGSKGAEALRKYLVRQGLHPPAFLGNGGR
jgi:hypothetical protein